MKKVIKLTESDLTRIVKRVIKENNNVVKPPLNLVARQLRKNDIEYYWSLNKDFIQIEDSKYRIYVNDNGTFRVQDNDAGNEGDKIYYKTPIFGNEQNQSPDHNSYKGSEDVVDWLQRWG
jgi:hypothetical protein